jgi:GlpG protein
MAPWGYLPADQIWDGKVWPLWTTALLHADIVHLFFNLYWLWFFGSHLEPRLGRLKFATLCVLATFVSSSAELTVSSDTGIGLSGLIYAFFGYLCLAPKGSELATLMSRRTIVWLLGWLFVCLVATLTHTYAVANAAHFAGITFGAALGFTQRTHPRVGQGSVAALLSAAVAILFWSPWSTQWLNSRAYNALNAGDTKLASDYLERVLRIAPEDPWASEQKRILDLQEAPKPQLDALLADAANETRPISKQEIAKEMLKFGSIQILIDPARDDVVVPSNLKKQGELTLVIGYDLPKPIPDLRIDTDGISGTLSFNQQPFLCRIPWTAVNALTLDQEHSLVWPSDQ